MNIKAVIFGGGSYGKMLKKGLEKYYDVKIIAICDNDRDKWGGVIDNISVINPMQLLTVPFDKIFICIRKEHMFRTVKSQLLEMGISEEKIVIMQKDIRYQDAFLELDPIRKNWIKYFADYTRELGLIGSVAECGVYYGETAMFINKYWPDRTLYLCDTFEGFEERDVKNEANNFEVFKKGGFNTVCFKTESPEVVIETVKSRMCYPEKVQIYRGYFPDSIDNIKDKFCFVNLDMDLYEPQLKGLKYFWDKMEKGGVILLHDYFHPELPGVKAAVADFEKEINSVIPKIPIGDGSSIAVIKMG